MKAYKDENNDVWLLDPIKITIVLIHLLFEWLCLKFQIIHEWFNPTVAIRQRMVKRKMPCILGRL
jgi:hypothetical protein